MHTFVKGVELSLGGSVSNGATMFSVKMIDIISILL